MGWGSELLLYLFWYFKIFQTFTKDHDNDFKKINVLTQSQKLYFKENAGVYEKLEKK